VISSVFVSFSFSFACFFSAFVVTSLLRARASKSTATLLSSLSISDFFSLASLVFESLTGRSRFPRAGLVETARLVRAGRPEEMMRDLREFAPPDLSRLLGWMAAAHRMERPSDAATILNELERFRLPCEPLLPE